MRFTPTVDAYFKAWIMVETWHTGHIADITRFYSFVWAVHRNCRPRKGTKNSKRRLPSESDVKQAIMEAQQGDFDPTALRKKARYYSRLYGHLVDFANTPNCSDALIEKKDIFRYHFVLERQLGGINANSEQVAARMKDAFGDDWKEKLAERKRRIG